MNRLIKLLLLFVIASAVGCGRPAAISVDKIVVDEKSITIGSTRFDSQPTLSELREALGKPNHEHKLMNTVYVWDSVGLYVYHDHSSPQDTVVSVSVDLTQHSHQFSPKQIFSGELMVGDKVLSSSSSPEDLVEAGFRQEMGMHRLVLGRTTLFAEIKGAGGTSLSSLSISMRD